MIFTTPKKNKSLIDRWLKNVPQEMLQKILHVVETLQLEKNLRGKNTFGIPYDRFLQNEITLGDLELILTSLACQQIIDVYKLFPKSKVLSGCAIEPLGLNPKIVLDQNKDAEINIFPEELNYLEKKLNEKLHLPTPKISQQQKQPPNGWKIEEKKNKAYLMCRKKNKFIFPRIDSNKYLYFKYLWNFYGQTKKYPELAETVGWDYPHKRGKNNKVNKRIRDTLGKLRKKMNGLPIKLHEKMGWSVEISSK